MKKKKVQVLKGAKKLRREKEREIFAWCYYFIFSEGKDLSVETLARQANKLHDKEVNAKKQSEGDLDEEVVISLR